MKGGRLRREVFLSHASADEDFALRVAGVLRRHGMRVWFAPTQLVPADQWLRKIGLALARCSSFVLIMSPDAARSKWVALELVYAMRNPKRYGDRIVPVIIRPCKFRGAFWPLEGIQHLDFSDPTRRDWDALLNVWRLKYRDKGVEARKKGRKSKGR